MRDESWAISIHTAGHLWGCWQDQLVSLGARAAGRLEGEPPTTVSPPYYPVQKAGSTVKIEIKQPNRIIITIIKTGVSEELMQPFMFSTLQKSLITLYKNQSGGDKDPMCVYECVYVCSDE